MTNLFFIAGGLLLYTLVKSKKMDISDTWDKYTNLRIAKLHPKIRDKFKAAINECERKGMKVRLASGTRSFAEQTKIYAQGRTEPGKVVTKAKAGQSYHNYALAGDVVEIKNGKALWKNPNWHEIGKIFESHGFTWGGRWTRFRDLPHMQMNFGLHWSKLFKIFKAQNFKGFVKI
ncbi:MAG: M15 family metallopeptidase [Bacteroidales bacterium]|nr:M15 family metallopeptidase [Bacteroidales bacterium]